MTALLVTGVGRSGTTLVEKLLHAHPDVCVGSQPFPDLYLRAKAGFLAGLGIERPNPVGPRFAEPDGSLADIAAHLEADRWGPERLDDLFAAMAGNDGQYMPELASDRAAVAPGGFFEVYDQLLAAMARRLGCADAAVVGSKETWFEELAAIMLDRGGAAVIVLRDPRDVLTSLRYGRGREHGGAVRPTLFVLRQWRKSVAFAIHLAGRDRFAAVRYEDVVGDAAAALTAVAERLGVGPAPGWPGRSVRDQDGAPWAGNSSFGAMEGVDPGGVGRWRDHLDGPTARYAAAVCGPELAWLGYEAEPGDPAAIAAFREPAFVGHPRFAAGYSTSAEAVAAETRRLELLAAELPPNVDGGEWFVFPEVHGALRAGAAAPRAERAAT